MFIVDVVDENTNMSKLWTQKGVLKLKAIDTNWMLIFHSTTHESSQFGNLKYFQNYSEFPLINQQLKKVSALLKISRIYLAVSDNDLCWMDFSEVPINR